MSERFLRLRSVLLTRQPDLTVLLEGVTKPHNLAAIMRSADAAGVLDVNAVALREAFSRRPRASAGSRRWVKVRRHETSVAAIADLRARGHQIVIACPTESSLSYTDYDYTQPTAVVFGTELLGISDEARAQADAAIHVPMLGLCESLNVSVTAALILYEGMRQRQAKGMYDTCRLDETLFAERLFEWAWPQVAHYCRYHKIPYPKMDTETGEILEQLPGSPTKPWS